MKTTNRITKAAVVVIVVGFGFFHNINNRLYFYEPIELTSSRIESKTIEKDTLKTCDTGIYNYTKSFIKTSIIHFISNL